MLLLVIYTPTGKPAVIDELYTESGLDDEPVCTFPNILTELKLLVVGLAKVLLLKYAVIPDLMLLRLVVPSLAVFMRAARSSISAFVFEIELLNVYVLT